MWLLCHTEALFRYLVGLHQKDAAFSASGLKTAIPHSQVLYASLRCVFSLERACVQAGRSHGQAVSVTSVPQVNVTMQTGPFNPIILYGLQPEFSATILSNGSLPSTTACPFLWMNGTQTISVLPQFSQASTSSAINGGLVSRIFSSSCLNRGSFAGDQARIGC